MCRSEKNPGLREYAQAPASEAGRTGVLVGSKDDIRLVAIDLDGTLLNDSKQVSGQTVDALKCLPSRGVKVVIASARPPRSVKAVYQQLHLDTLQINYNGALIWDPIAARSFFHQPMEPKKARAMIDFARSRFGNITMACEVLDRWLTDREDQPYTTETGKLFKPDAITDLDACCAEPVTKLMFLGPPEQMTILHAELTGKFAPEFSIMHTDPDLIQIMDCRAGKANALIKVAGHYDIEMKNVMAIGDAINDIEMLKVSGLPIAMDNAHPAVKAVAKWIAPTNNDHGVHAALVRYGLCG